MSERIEPFASVAQYLENAFHPKGSPVETEPVDVKSVDEALQLFVDEFQVPKYKPLLVDFLNSLSEIQEVQAVCLVSFSGYGILSIRPLCDFNKYHGSEVRKRYNDFKGLFLRQFPNYKMNPMMHFYHTNGEEISALIPGILENIKREEGMSQAAFIVYDRQEA